MGSNFGKQTSSLLDSLPSSSSLHIVMLGLDAAGKTTVLYRMKFDQYCNAVPTVGFNCEKVKMTSGKAKGTSFVIWDVGGQEKLRPLWKSYTRNTDGIVFVVDSVDIERLEEARIELIRTARTPENSGVPILIIANKQDLPGAVEPREIEKLMALHELSQNHIWHVQPACAITGDGLNEALEKLSEMVQKRKKSSKGTVKRKR